MYVVGVFTIPLPRPSKALESINIQKHNAGLATMDEVMSTMTHMPSDAAIHIRPKQSHLHRKFWLKGMTKRLPISMPGTSIAGMIVIKSPDQAGL
jgi:hypothetical protein